MRSRQGLALPFPGGSFHEDVVHAQIRSFGHHSRHRRRRVGRRRRHAGRPSHRRQHLEPDRRRQRPDIRGLLCPDRRHRRPGILQFEPYHRHLLGSLLRLRLLPHRCPRRRYPREHHHHAGRGPHPRPVPHGFGHRPRRPDRLATLFPDRGRQPPRQPLLDRPHHRRLQHRPARRYHLDPDHQRLGQRIRRIIRRHRIARRRHHLHRESHTNHRRPRLPRHQRRDRRGV